MYYEIGNKKYKLTQHNAGTDSLFQAFALMLTGNNDCMNYIPYYLDISNGGNSILKSKVNCTGKTISDNKCVMTFSVPSDLLIEDGTATSQIHLYNMNGKIELAYLTMDLSSFTVGSGLNILVQWEMSVGNATANQ